MSADVQTERVLGATKGDLASLVRWFRSRYGPLCAEAESGSLTMAVTGEAITFRRLLQILDADEVAVRQIDIFGSATSVTEVRALFSAYRRLRRAQRRVREEGARLSCLND